MPPIFFYIHPKFWPRGVIPESPDVAWSGFNFGVYTWTIQTYCRLKRRGLPCELTPDFPREGIVFAHRECMTVGRDRLRPTRAVLLVNVAADLALYPSAHLHVVQNPSQSYWYRNCYYITHWPEPGLVPRRAQRGDRFEKVAFFGNDKGLAAELRTAKWRDTLASCGFEWMAHTGVFQYDQPSAYEGVSVWSDYSDVDAVLAVRSFVPHTRSGGFGHKPPSKLVNAWLAGVPAILGCESAYLSRRRSELDYVDVHSVDEALSALKRLRDDPELRTAMCHNGRQRAKEVCASQTEDAWLDFIEHVAIPAYVRWRSAAAWEQHLAVGRNQAMYPLMRARKKIITMMISS